MARTWAEERAVPEAKLDTLHDRLTSAVEGLATGDNRQFMRQGNTAESHRIALVKPTASACGSKVVRPK